MKKVLVLMFVLSMATLVSAAPMPLQLSLNGKPAPDEVTIMPSDWITIDITDSVGANWLVYLDAYNLSEGLFRLAQPRWSEAAGDGGTMFVGPYDARTDYQLDAMELEITQAWAPATTKRAGSVFEIDFHCMGEGDVIVILADDSGTLIDKMTIHQIPEPMTMALLGLGGLFLRRR